MGKISWDGEFWVDSDPESRLRNLRDAAPALLKALLPIARKARREHDSGGGIFSTQEVEALEAAIAAARGVKK